MSRELWRVDNALKTCVLVHEVIYDVEIGVWYPVLFGNGAYAYFEEEEEAIESLLQILNSDLCRVQNMIKETKLRISPIEDLL